MVTTCREVLDGSSDRAATGEIATTRPPSVALREGARWVARAADRGLTDANGGDILFVDARPHDVVGVACEREQRLAGGDGIARLQRPQRVAGLRGDALNGAGEGRAHFQPRGLFAREVEIGLRAGGIGTGRDEIARFRFGGVGPRGRERRLRLPQRILRRAHAVAQNLRLARQRAAENLPLAARLFVRDAGLFVARLRLQ